MLKQDHIKYEVEWKDKDGEICKQDVRKSEQIINDLKSIGYEVEYSKIKTFNYSENKVLIPLWYTVFFVKREGYELAIGIELNGEMSAQEREEQLKEIIESEIIDYENLLGKEGVVDEGFVQQYLNKYVELYLTPEFEIDIEEEDLYLKDLKKSSKNTLDAINKILKMGNNQLEDLITKIKSQEEKEKIRKLKKDKKCQEEKERKLEEENKNKASERKETIRGKIEEIRAKIKEAYYADDIVACYSVLKEAELLNKMHNEILEEEPDEIPEEEQWYRNGGSFMEYNGLDLIETEENIKKTIFAKTKEFIENNYQEEGLKEKLQKEIFDIDIDEEENWETIYAVVLNAVMDGSLDFDSKKRFAARMQNSKINDIKSQYVFYIDSLKKDDFEVWVDTVFSSQTQEQKDRLYNEIKSYDGRVQIKKLMQDTKNLEVANSVLRNNIEKIKANQDRIDGVEKEDFSEDRSEDYIDRYKQDLKIERERYEKEASILKSKISKGPIWSVNSKSVGNYNPQLEIVFKEEYDEETGYLKKYKSYDMEQVIKFILNKKIPSDKEAGVFSINKLNNEQINHLIAQSIGWCKEYGAVNVIFKDLSNVYRDSQTMCAALNQEEKYEDLFERKEIQPSQNAQCLAKKPKFEEEGLFALTKEQKEQVIIYFKDPAAFIKDVEDYKKSEEERMAEEMRQTQAKRKEELKGYTIKQAMPRINEVVIKHYNGEVLLCDNRVFSYFELEEEGEDPILNAKCITRLGFVKDLSKKSKKELYLQSADSQKNKEEWLHHIEKISSRYDIPFYYDQELANEDIYKYFDISKRIQIKEKMKNELKDELKRHAKIKESIKAKWIKYETYCEDNEIKDKSALKKDLTKEENEVNILEILRDDAERLSVSVRDWESIIGAEEKIEDLLYSKENPNGLKYYITQIGNLKYFYLENSEHSYIDAIEIEEN